MKHPITETTYYGPSTGDTGQYGIGDIVEGQTMTEQDGTLMINDEPVYNVFTINNNEIEYVD